MAIRSADRRAVAVWSVVAGCVLGAVDFVWIKFLPGPLGGLGNSPAVWAVAAFGLGYQVRAGWAWAAAAGAAMLIVAVPSYYLMATVVQNDEVQVIWSPDGLTWMFFGVLAGTVFGTAGAWARQAGWWAGVGIALPMAVLWGEAGVLLRRGQPGDLWMAALLAAFGMAMAFLGRTARHRLTALAAAVPVTLAGFLAYQVVGVGGGW